MRKISCNSEDSDHWVDRTRYRELLLHQCYGPWRDWHWMCRDVLEYFPFDCEYLLDQNWEGFDRSLRSFNIRPSSLLNWKDQRVFNYWFTKHSQYILRVVHLWVHDSFCRANWSKRTSRISRLAKLFNHSILSPNWGVIGRMRFSWGPNRIQRRKESSQILPSHFLVRCARGHSRIFNPVSITR